MNILGIIYKPYSYTYNHINVQSTQEVSYELTELYS